MALRRVRGFDLGEIGQAAARLLRPQRDGASLGDRELRRARAELEACLDARFSGVTVRTRAEAVAARYAGLDANGRRRFFELLAEEYGEDRVRLAVALAGATTRSPSTDGPAGAAADAKTRRRLREALVPRWERLFELFCALPGGVKFTVDLRAELLEVLAAPLPDSTPALPTPALPKPALPTPALTTTEQALPADCDTTALRTDVERATRLRLEELDEDLRTVLSRLFPPGLLELRRITWDTPASMLEKLIRYEAVHEITSWDDLRNRLDHDRRCYAFAHPGMPAEPLIFVEVALGRGMAAEIGPLLDVSAPLGDPDDADTAIFYSISACQSGLSGVNLGDVLIKDVVNDLRAQLPRLETFATLSPIPGFRRWFERRLLRPSPPTDGPAVTTTEEQRALAELAVDDERPVDTVRRLLADVEWVQDPARVAVLRPVLLRAGAHYLTSATREGRAVDRVANFHLTNGARIERLNWLANRTPTGLMDSYGMMVNYRYELDRIDANHESYLAEGRITRAPAIGRLLG